MFEDAYWDKPIEKEDVIEFKMANGELRFRDVNDLQEELFPRSGVLLLNNSFKDGQEFNNSHILLILKNSKRIGLSPQEKSALETYLTKQAARVEVITQASFNELVDVACALVQSRQKNESPEQQYNVLRSGLPESEFVDKNKARLKDIGFPKKNSENTRRIDYPSNLKSFLCVLDKEVAGCDQKGEAWEDYLDSQNLTVDFVNFVIDLHKRYFSHLPLQLQNTSDDDVRRHRTVCTKRKRNSKRGGQCSQILPASKRQKERRCKIKTTAELCHIHRKVLS